ncbi:hypothetical protein QLT07_06375 [Streptococcus equi subsp. zooepidemicus]|uniref:Uncharacterized protein n=1 Tax=Streptococcus equi subsp. ruminatorum CECT 5772 TaxID=1051981 RepID=A0A922NUI6_9STRE|nr:hypothetical protein [Streptococcus equi]HEL1012543.1 hypothetical protein [Streptococcus equi subsp. ruminatorum]KED04283.1 hypothetical protein CECT5772_06118 [Streptococcus equi subsp. ruminatorum CECT 5772]MDI6044189.1 hypothetical protein [Streptococcus equi subsp. zooepidemicus]WOK57442.1 hypothetical protein RIM63_01350 [Streptococcus equi subsp. zooepidemicus]HEK9098030.1 hypothetical protein [Streptococcus equi subsp. zooepidemicus]
MGITQMTWEEYETFNKVETPDNLYIREHRGYYYTFFELGVASVRRIFELSAADFEEYLKGLCTADEILFKVQNDCWPPTEEEKKELEKNAIRKSPTVLIDIPRFREYFTQEELKELIPIAEQQWIDWKGKLPDDYVSPLK